MRLARAHQARGDEATALRILREAKDINPEAATELVLTNNIQGDEAITLRQHHANNDSVDVSIPLANLYNEMKRTSEEIALLRRAVTAGEPNAVHNLGLALWQAEHQKEGKALLKTAARKGDQLASRALHRLRRRGHRK